MPDNTQPLVERRRVGVIGPVLPYRGGIAQHTTMLIRAMREQADTLVLSYSRQYPGWLFPGQSDRDDAYRDHREPGVQYLIDSVNPLTWRRAARRLAEFRPEFVLLPWWTVYWVPFDRALMIALFWSRIPVVLLCHNVLDHEAAAWKRMLTLSVLGRADRFVVHTREEAKRLRELVRDANVTVHPHPTYDQFPPAAGTLPRRADLELLFYGFIRPYKGLDILLQAMASLKNRSVKLTVAGEIWGDPKPYFRLIEDLGLKKHVELIPRYVTEHETAELFQRADVVVLPYRSATGSGVIPIAYHYGKPVVATRVGGLPDVVREGETGFLVETGSPQALTAALADLSAEAMAGMQGAVRNLAASMSWESLASTVLRHRSESPTASPVP